MPDPTIIIADRVWPIPFLAPRQNRIVIPALVQLGTQPQVNYDLLLDAVYAALTRAYPELARDEFEELPIPTYELLESLPVISKQTGMMQGAKGARSASGELPNWDAIIADFVGFLLGTTPDYWEDALTGPRLEAQYEHWRKFPPMTVLYAGRHGYKPKPRTEDAIEHLLAIFPDGYLRCGPTMH